MIILEREREPNFIYTLSRIVNKTNSVKSIFPDRLTNERRRLKDNQNLVLTTRVNINLVPMTRVNINLAPMTRVNALSS